MLVLSRKNTEAIQIGKDVKVTVLEILGNRVKIGIDAPRGVDILRQEVYLKQQDQPQQGVQP